MEVRTLAFLALAVMASAQSWTPQKSGTTASLRGIAAVSDKIGWASGTGGTYLLTVDGGATWTAGQVPGAEELDFRDVHALDAQTAWLLSAGPGEKSRIYHTIDGGRSWTLQFTNPDAAGFFDAIAFWDARRGMVLGDPIAGHFAYFVTDDGGDRWRRTPSPAAFPNEGAFAASGTCLIVAGRRDAWFATGGARIFHSSDSGATWSATQTPIRHDSPRAGFSRWRCAIRGAASRSGAITRSLARTSTMSQLRATADGPGRNPDSGRQASGQPLRTCLRCGFGSRWAHRDRTFRGTAERRGSRSTRRLTMRWLSLGRRSDGAIARFASR